MKRITLITTRNFLYRSGLAARGYSVTEFGFPPSAGVLAEIQGMDPGDAAVIEVSPASIESHADLYRSVGMRERVICCGDGLCPDVKRFLLGCGITDCIAAHDDEKLMAALKSTCVPQEPFAGTLVVLEHGSAIQKVLRSIAGRFNYRVLFVSGTEDLLDRSQGGVVQFVLVNLGAAGLDLNGLVRKSYTRELARSIPVLAYKDMREGLFVHELVCGLNRLTKYILSLEELYGILVELFYRNEMMPLVASLTRQMECETNACFHAESLSRAFFECEKSIFIQPSLLNEEAFCATADIGQRMQRLIMKVESFKWLRLEVERNLLSTAGREG